MESLQTIIATCAPEAGLSSRIIPFASGTTLKERLSANPVLMAPMAGVRRWCVSHYGSERAEQVLRIQKWFLLQEIHYGGEKTWGACRASCN